MHSVIESFGECAALFYDAEWGEIVVDENVCTCLDDECLNLIG